MGVRSEENIGQQLRYQTLTRTVGSAPAGRVRQTRTAYADATSYIVTPERQKEEGQQTRAVHSFMSIAPVTSTTRHPAAMQCRLCTRGPVHEHRTRMRNYLKTQLPQKKQVWPAITCETQEINDLLMKLQRPVT
jgi:hypothetical protein